MRFTKMQGLGNDFILLDDRQAAFDLTQAPSLAKAICHRNFGVGGDGLVFIRPSRIADFAMRIFNSDGSEAEMCGNAIRCLAKYAFEEDLTRADAMEIETLEGIKPIRLKVVKGVVATVEADMGEPVLTGSLIPVNMEGERIVSETISTGDASYNFTAVSMGNPHCVIFVENDPGPELQAVGALLEKHPLFPKKTNVEFVRVLNREEIKVWVFERGVGPTLACGTGACAAAVAASLNGHTGRKVKVHLPGGTLDITWSQDNHVFMAGPAGYVFVGEMKKSWLEKLNRGGYYD